MRVRGDVTVNLDRDSISRRSIGCSLLLMILVAGTSVVNPGVYNNSSALFLPSASRGSPHVEGSQAYAPRWNIHEANVVFQASTRLLTQAGLPQWYVHEAGVDFYVAGRSSHCRIGAMQKKGEGVGAGCRMRGRKKGRKKGKLFGGGWKSQGRLEEIEKRRRSAGLPVCFEG